MTCVNSSVNNLLKSQKSLPRSSYILLTVPAHSSVHPTIVSFTLPGILKNGLWLLCISFTSQSTPQCCSIIYCPRAGMQLSCMRMIKPLLLSYILSGHVGAGLGERKLSKDMREKNSFGTGYHVGRGIGPKGGSGIGDRAGARFYLYHRLLSAPCSKI